MAATADRNLLCGLLAWQNGLLNASQLLAGLRAWAGEKQTPLSDHLIRLGVLSNSAGAQLEDVVSAHLALFDGKAERGLSVLSALKEVSQEILTQIHDPDIEKSLRHVSMESSVPLTRTHTSADAERDLQPFDATTRFEILRRHASGGLGQVSVAMDRELNREVALKEIRAEFSDDADSRARFLGGVHEMRYRVVKSGRPTAARASARSRGEEIRATQPAGRPRAPDPLGAGGAGRHRVVGAQ